MRPLTARTLMVALSSVVLSSAAGAQVVVDVGTAGAAGNNPSAAIGSGVIGANDFTLATATTVTGASFWSYDLSGPAFAGTLRYFFFEPASGDPISTPGAAPTAQGDVTAYTSTVVYSAAGPSVVRRYDFTFVQPVGLTAGRHFFGLTAASGGTFGTPNWIIGSPVGTSYGSAAPAVGWGRAQGEFAFQLVGTPGITTAPEPATAALLAAGLIAVGGLSARRRRRASTRAAASAP